MADPETLSVQSSVASAGDNVLPTPAESATMKSTNTSMNASIVPATVPTTFAPSSQNMEAPPCQRSGPSALVRLREEDQTVKPKPKRKRNKLVFTEVKVIHPLLSIEEPVSSAQGPDVQYVLRWEISYLPFGCDANAEPFKRVQGELSGDGACTDEFINVPSFSVYNDLRPVSGRTGIVEAARLPKISTANSTTPSVPTPDMSSKSAPTTVSAPPDLCSSPVPASSPCAPDNCAPDNCAPDNCAPENSSPPQSESADSIIDLNSDASVTDHTDPLVNDNEGNDDFENSVDNENDNDNVDNDNDNVDNGFIEDRLEKTTERVSLSYGNEGNFCNVVEISDNEELENETVSVSKAKRKRKNDRVVDFSRVQGFQRLREMGHSLKLPQVPKIDFFDSKLDYRPSTSPRFATKEQCVEYAQRFAENHGYAFINDSKGYLRCDRHGERLSSGGVGAGNRQTSSKRSGCHFMVEVKYFDAPLYGWGIQYTSDKRRVGHHMHNHRPSAHPAAHQKHRIRALEQLQTLGANDVMGIMQSTQTSHRTMLLGYRHINDVAYNVTEKDLSNQVARREEELLNGMNPMQGLIFMLQNSSHFFCRYQFKDPLNLPELLVHVDRKVKHKPDHLIAEEVQNVFFAQTDSVELMREFPDVITLDCTYDTNDNKLKLLNFVGIDSCNKTFPVASAFVCCENVETYQWCFEKLKELLVENGVAYPRVVLSDCSPALLSALGVVFDSKNTCAKLCLWNVNEAVRRNLATFYSHSMERYNEMCEAWYKIQKCDTVEEFNTQYAAIKHDFADCESAVEYITRKWLGTDDEPRHRERIVPCFSGERADFMNMATSQVEGIHIYYKSLMRARNMSVFESSLLILRANMGLLADMKRNHGVEMLFGTWAADTTLFRNVSCLVSRTAIKEVEDQVKRLKEKQKGDNYDPGPCSGNYSANKGLPCMHTLDKLMAADAPLGLGDFDPHWRLLRTSYQLTELEWNEACHEGLFAERWRDLQRRFDAFMIRHCFEEASNHLEHPFVPNLARDSGILFEKLAPKTRKRKLKKQLCKLKKDELPPWCYRCDRQGHYIGDCANKSRTEFAYEYEVDGERIEQDVTETETEAVQTVET